jgi:hypothetical protein
MPINKYNSYIKWRLNQTGFYQISEWKEERGGQGKIKIHNVQCTVLNMMHTHNETVCGVISILFIREDQQDQN